MAQNILRSFMVSVFLLSTTGVAAQECGVMGQVYDVGGFTISGSKTSILAENKFTEFSKTLGEREVVNKITRFISSVNPNPRGSESPRALAQNIYDAAEAYGVDPIIFAAKIRQESGQFNVDVVARGGDTGLTQMTGNGLDEMTEQYKKLNSRNKSERQVGNVLAQLSKNYFGAANATNEWVDWAITKSNSQKKATLVRSVDYALASGASLFKIYLAVRNGSYRQAINQYNGGGTAGYYDKLNNHAESLRQITQRCGLSSNEVSALNTMCEIAGTKAGCESIVKEVIPSGVRQYDI